jgi:hypothetical protein
LEGYNKQLTKELFENDRLKDLSSDKVSKSKILINDNSYKHEFNNKSKPTDSFKCQALVEKIKEIDKKLSIPNKFKDRNRDVTQSSFLMNKQNYDNRKNERSKSSERTRSDKRQEIDQSKYKAKHIMNSGTKMDMYNVYISDKSMDNKEMSRDKSVNENNDLKNSMLRNNKNREKLLNIKNESSDKSIDILTNKSMDRVRDVSIDRARDVSMDGHRDKSMNKHTDKSMVGHRDKSMNRHRDKSKYRHRDKPMYRDRDRSMDRQRDKSVINANKLRDITLLQNRDKSIERRNDKYINNLGHRSGDESKFASKERLSNNGINKKYRTKYYKDISIPKFSDKIFNNNIFYDSIQKNNVYNNENLTKESKNSFNINKMTYNNLNYSEKSSDNVSAKYINSQKSTILKNDNIPQRNNIDISPINLMTPEKSPLLPQYNIDLTKEENSNKSNFSTDLEILKRKKIKQDMQDFVVNEILK